MRKYIVLFIFSAILLSVNAQTDTLSAERAVEYYKSILKKTKTSAFANYNLAAVYFAQKDYSASLKFSKRAIKEKSEFQADAYIVYGSSLDRQGSIKEAIEVFEEGLKLYPENYLMLYQYGFSCYKYRNHTKSISALEKVIKLQPLHITAHYLYGCTLFEGNNNPQCVNAFLYGLMLDSDSIRALQAISFVNSYMKQKPGDILIPFFEKRFALTSTNDILDEYFPPKSRANFIKDFEPHTFAKQIEERFEVKTTDSTVYKKLFDEIIQNNHAQTFSYYILRTMKNKYVTIWYTKHSKELESFAKFLENTLPNTTQ